MGDVHAFPTVPERRRDEPPKAPAYAELAVTTNFSFLRSGSHPEEFVVRARDLGLAGLGIADRNSVAGVVRAYGAAKPEEGETHHGLKLVVGARLVFADGTPDVLGFPQDRAAWGRLTRLLTVGKSRAEKADCILFRDDLLEHGEGLNLIVMPPRRINADALTTLLQRFVQNFSQRSIWLAAGMLYRGDDARRLARLAAIASDAFIPLIAVNDALYHVPERRALQDIVTCIRTHTTIEAAGRELEANAERHLKPPQEMARLFRRAPEAIAETLRFLERCRFSLDELRKTEYPDECPGGYATPQEALVRLAEEGACRRYPGGMRADIRRALDHELAITAELKYAPYFLTVHEIVQYARRKGILCQGRGSAANSVICYCLGITEVDPTKVDLLFERFVSAERREPPDIDVDFEHERREEVIQHIYRHYGRQHAGLAATVICYRGRSAIREAGKAFGLSEDTVGALARTLWGWSMDGVTPAEARRAGFDPGDPRLQQVIALAKELMGFPRHLSQHVGGFVITRSRLDEVVPVENAAMDDRTVIEWDKDDLDALSLLKVDVLGLGMLSCLRRSFDLLKEYYVNANAPLMIRRPVPQRPLPQPNSGLPELGRSKTPKSDKSNFGCRGGTGRGVTTNSELGATPHPNPPPTQVGPARLAQYELQPGQARVAWGREQTEFAAAARTQQLEETEASIPLGLAAILDEDQAIYSMLSRADSVGVFQVESRAQMSMLPRLRPKEFYDLVIEVAIVRPGPIQGDMVHPYLQRREKLRHTGEVPTYPSPSPLHGDKDELKQVLHKTLGVPLFQEQAMRIAIVAAKFPPAKADRLRRAMATFKRVGTIDRFRAEFVDGMIRRGYPPDFAARCFSQIEGFGEYGFPESHAASFAILVYASAWIKCRYPDVFAAALINSQPMGFYAPAQIVRDAQEHGVEVLPVDINRSDWDCSLEPGSAARERLHARHASMRNDIRSTHAVRLGLRQVNGFSKDHALTIESVRGRGFDSVRDVWLRTHLSPSTLERLAEADAFRSLGLDRHDALWAVRALQRSGDKDDLPLFARVAMPELEPDAALPPMLPGEQVVADYRHLHLSLKAHPVSFIRTELDRRRILRNEELTAMASGRRVTVAGLVLVRQRPGDAKAIFMTLEDETGTANTILWLRTFETYRPVVLGARLISVTGMLQNEYGVIHVVAQHLEDLSPLLHRLSESPATVQAVARCDEIMHPEPGNRSAKRRHEKHAPLSREDAQVKDADVVAVLPKGRNFH